MTVSPTATCRLYGPNDDRLDRAFSIFYMGINLGGFLAPMVGSPSANILF